MARIDPYEPGDDDAPADERLDAVKSRDDDDPVAALHDTEAEAGDEDGVDDDYDMDDRAARVGYKLALSRYRSGNFEGALAALEATLRNDEQMSTAHYLRGLCLQEEVVDVGKPNRP